jgi:putative aldouronate transport system permease protein
LDGVNTALSAKIAVNSRSLSKKILWRIKSCWQLYIFLLPAGIYVLIFDYLPMYGVQIAFKNFRSSLGIWNSPWIGFDHFKRFIQYPYFLRIVWNTLSINLYSLVIGFPAPVLLALLINEIRSASFKKTAQMITYAPHFISTVVMCSLILLFLNKDAGVINRLILAIGLSPIDFMTQAGWFKTIYVVTGIWQNMGWGTIIYLAALAGVSLELIEAARIDGANRIRVIWHINLPHLLPTIVILLILRCGSLLSLGFEKIWLLQNPLNLEASEIISTYVYKVGLENSQFSYSAAIGLFNTSVNLALLISVNAFSRWVSETSLW